MNTKETILARAAEIIAQRTVRQDKDSFGTLITIDPDGSPVPTTISPSRSEGIRWITFCTGRGAPEFANLSYLPHWNGGGLHRPGNLPGDVVRGFGKSLFRSR